jgi:hypothetical protein
MTTTWIATAALIAAVLPVQAALVNTPGALPGPTTVIDFQGFDGLLTAGPHSVAAGVTFTGDAGSELGAYIRDLGENGVWGAGNRFLATAFIGEVRFSFNGQLTQGAGALVNHFDNRSGLPFAVVVSAYGASSQIIETYTVSVATPFDSYNQGLFLGISRPTADIVALSFKGVGVVVDNFTYTAPIPEPAALALMLAGLGAVGFISHRRRRDEA